VGRLAHLGLAVASWNHQTSKSGCGRTAAAAVQRTVIAAIGRLAATPTEIIVQPENNDGNGEGVWVS